MGLEELEIHMQKNESRHRLYTFRKINSKWITDLNIKCKTVKLLEDNTKENLDDLGYGNDFFFLINLFILFFIYFIFGCIGSSLCAWAFLSLRRAGATLRCGAQAFHCDGFSCCRARALGVWASVVVAHGLSSCGSQALERRLSSCGTRA